ncbi:MAG: type II toxin-antitoxin system HicA family toxin [Pyrinomonadaceae bacterium]|nr:type II toxin-antitoxin system HicA family toxin [Pyrinomonadaceae bacterium]
MPPKIRELIAELERGGFTNRGGKGSHRNYWHRSCSKIVTISGKTGNDAEKYQIKQVKEAIEEIKSK